MDPVNHQPAKDFTSLSWAPLMVAVLAGLFYTLSGPAPVAFGMTAIAISFIYLLASLFLALKHPAHRRRFVFAGLVGGLPFLSLFLGTLWQLTAGGGIHF